MESVLGLLPKAVAISTAVSASVAALAAAFGFMGRAQAWYRQGRHERHNEIQRLLSELTSVKHILARYFDYQGLHDLDLRIHDLYFSNAEAKTRTEVDEAFEHLRNVHRSLKLGLVKKADLDPWVYWVHRVRNLNRKPLHEYEKACGYSVFMDDLRSWTRDSKQLSELKANCTWWDVSRTSAAGTQDAMSHRLGSGGSPSVSP